MLDSAGDEVLAMLAVIVYLELRAALARHGVAPRRATDQQGDA